jgi:hypothetical protein
LRKTIAEFASLLDDEAIHDDHVWGRVLKFANGTDLKEAVSISIQRICF